VSFGFGSDAGGGVRQLNRDSDGKLVMTNQGLYLNKKGKGIGTRIFAKQVKKSMELGVDKIATKAEGNPKGTRAEKQHNGYYTWARLGYNLEIPHHVQQEAKQAGFGDVTNTHELFVQKGGPEWWRENGVTSHGEFDLTPGSHSLKMLHGYMKEKGISV
jgi:hypothetical protein